MPLWPKLDLSGVGLHKVPKPPKPAPPSIFIHDREWCRTYWRCKVCLRIKRQVALLLGNRPVLMYRDALVRSPNALFG
eukprot:9489174-Pyramimonas_sp.AAC.1